MVAVGQSPQRCRAHRPSVLKDPTLSARGDAPGLASLGGYRGKSRTIRTVGAGRVQAYDFADECLDSWRARRWVGSLVSVPGERDVHAESAAGRSFRRTQDVSDVRQSAGCLE